MVAAWLHAGGAKHGARRAGCEVISVNSPIENSNRRITPNRVESRPSCTVEKVEG